MKILSGSFSNVMNFLPSKEEFLQQSKKYIIGAVALVAIAYIAYLFANHFISKPKQKQPPLEENTPQPNPFQTQNSNLTLEPIKPTVVTYPTEAPTILPPITTNPLHTTLPTFTTQSYSLFPSAGTNPIFPPALNTPRTNVTPPPHLNPAPVPKIKPITPPVTNTTTTAVDLHTEAVEAIPEETREDKVSLISKLTLIKNYLTNKNHKLKNPLNVIFNHNNLAFSGETQYFNSKNNIYTIECEDESTKETIQITINQGNKDSITSISINESEVIDDPKDLPKIWVDRLTAAWKKINELTSSYSYNQSGFEQAYAIRMVHGSVEAIPEYHLKKVSEIIGNYKNTFVLPPLKIKFLDAALKELDGNDVGGLTRDYFSSLFESLTTSTRIKFVKTSALLHIPTTKQSPKSEENSSPPLTVEEKQIYEQIGMIMMYSFKVAKNDARNNWTNAKYFTIGKIFDESLFKGIFSLTQNEIDTPFEKLSTETKLKMCQTVLKARKAAGEPALDAYLTSIQNCLDLLKPFDSQKIKKIVDFEHLVCQLPEEFIDANDEPDIEKIEQNIPRLFDLLSQTIFHKEADGFTLESTLAPIHAIAVGMKSMVRPPHNYGGTAYGGNADIDCYWPYGQHSVGFADEFDRTVQGSLDREEICRKLTIDYHGNHEVNKKVGWLKDWIKDEINGATESKLKNFLKYYIGSTSLPRDKQIHVQSQTASSYYDRQNVRHTQYSPIPQAGTCNSLIMISPQPCGHILTAEEIEKLSKEKPIDPDDPTRTIDPTDRSLYANDHTKASFYDILNNLDPDGAGFSSM